MVSNGEFMTVPFLDLGSQYHAIKDDVLSSMTEVMSKANFILGHQVSEFENNFASYVECQYAVGVASGLDALKLGLKVLGIGQGDQVITTANTFIASTLAINAVGATPVLVDVELDTFNMDSNQLESAINTKTKAIMPVHLYGQPVNLDEVMRIAKRYDLFIIEDASQAHGARYKGKRIGSFGDLAAFSFYPSKNLGAYGDGGIVTTNNRVLAEKLRSYRNYGSTKKYYHEVLGENSRLDTIQAVVLNVKLPQLDSWNEKRREVAHAYNDKLSGIGDVITPKIAQESEHVFHLYVIRTKRRDDLAQYLNEKGIGNIIHYPVPIHLQEVYQDYAWQRGDFPHTEQLANEILSLPMYPNLTSEQLDEVVTTIKAFYAKL
jgi:dTDP-4-amino-4,6-dideoxygalactose transaminase